ncbi:NlpC/P60 family protein [Oricola sp.]|uniref:C40 family peptidase n=1 Tax=Oricola sp. TaxID=1979950 RepID=UPI003BAD78F7
MNTSLDPRLNAWRADLADRELIGKVEATRFVSGEPAVIGVPVANIHREPFGVSGMDTQFLFGDTVAVFERSGGWAWVQGGRDGYVGYVVEDSLLPAGAAPTHRVTAFSTFVYPGPDLKRPPLSALSIGSCVTVTGKSPHRKKGYLLLADGSAVFASHLAPLGEDAADWVAVAEQFLHTPYLWAGTSAFGVDCSGLVQLAMYAAGRNVLRDTYMQEESIGDGLPMRGGMPALRRGDLVFWKGHVGVMTDSENLLHANGNTMTVAREPLDAAIARIAPAYGSPTSVRRP